MLLAVNSVHGQCTEVTNCNSCEDRGPECISCAANKALSMDRKSCLDCPTDCAKCEREGNTDDLVCLECASGYLKEGACEACTLEHCEKCTVAGEEETCIECDDPGYSLSSGKCVGCPTGKYLDGTSCKSCPTNAISCTTGGTVTACKDEGTKYVKSSDAKSCKACSGCVKCALDDTDAKCTECKENEYLTDDKACSYCNSDNAGTKCKSCGDAGECSECNAKYYLKDGLCEDCPSNCDECSEDDTDGLVCGTCSVNYGLNEEIICDECPSKCDVCDVNGQCTDCEEKYVPVSGVCEQCPSKCLECNTDATTCTSCETGADLGLNSDDEVQCYDLPTGCTDLATLAADIVAGEDRPQCKTCALGYGLDDADNQCYTCGGNSGVTGCQRCTISSGTVTCTADSGSDLGCETGYGQWDDSGTKKCAACNQVTDCTECTASDATTITCTACVAGKDLYGSGSSATCVSCTTGTSGAIANCKECTISDNSGSPQVDSCDTCDDGYGIDSGNSMCVSCTAATTGGESLCVACTANGADDVTCTDCGDNIQYTSTDAAVCTASCGTGCTACSLASSVVTCDTCDNGYRSKSDNSGCIKCVSPCALCSTDGDGNQQCTQCNANHVVGSDPCEACPENCETCSDATTCTTCKDEYGKDADGNCVECIANCLDCDADADGKQLCTQCNAKYHLEDDDCVACPSNCKECSYDAGVMECSKCADEYVLNSGKCDKCPSNCNECSSATKCKTGKCKSGFAVNDNGECIDCATLTGIANCASCSEKPDSNSSAPCLACSTGFTLKDNLQSGDDAECVQTTGVDCKTGGVLADRPFQCDEGSCTGETTQTDDNLCGRQCYVCGDYHSDVFISAEDCKTDNTTGEVILCPSGFCAMKSRKVDGKHQVAGGCLPTTGTCDSPDEVDCKDVGEGDAKLEQCTKCCDNNLCLQKELTNGLESNNLAPATSANFLLLVSCSMGALVLRLSLA